MTGPVLILCVLFAAAMWLLARPTGRAFAPDLVQPARGLVIAGLMVVAALVLFLIKLAPFGVVALVLGFGAATNALSKAKGAPGLHETPQADDWHPPVEPVREGMARAEALSVLGLQEGADDAAIDAAHRKMILRAHPDAGGSDYLAAKVNEARTVLRG